MGIHKKLAGPEQEQLEITVLGNGLGESIVVHYGLERWAIIDSFEVNNGIFGKEAAALRYLDSIGVPPNKVKNLFLTHLHADHFRGFDLIVEACREIDDFYFPFPNAKTVDRLRELDDEKRTAFAVLKTTLETIEAKKKNFAVHDPTHVLDGSAQILTPTKQLRRKSTAFLSEDFETNPNYYSIVMRLFGSAVALLAGDLINHAEFGWEELLRVHPEEPRASFVKVAHHGSSGAHSEDLFTKFSDSPLAVITRHVNGRFVLPDETFVPTIRALTSALHVIGYPPTTKDRKGKGQEAMQFVTARSDGGGRFQVTAGPNYL
jgi:beta-lactamase superfamily II metal-dependent hydrolase